MTQIIDFYGRHLPYMEFSNFYRRQIIETQAIADHFSDMVQRGVVKFNIGTVWKTSEAFYQAQKFYDPNIAFENNQHMQDVIKAATPGEAADIGRERNRPLRSDWEEVKDDVMRIALWMKFTQHQDLKEILLGTGDAILFEHTVNDSYWGDGGKHGLGKNMLGKLLMELRKILQG